MLLYQLTRVKHMQERKVSEIVIENQRILGEVQEIDVIIEEGKEYLEVVKKEWEEFKLRAKEYKEEEIIDLHLSELSGDIPEIK